MTLPTATAVWLTASAAVAAVAVGTGAALAASGVFAADPPPVSVVFAQTVDGLDCPGGDAVMSFPRNSRVLAVSRSDDGAFLGVRNPLNVDTTVWIPIEVVEADADQPAIDTLEVARCSVPEITVTAEAAQPPVVEQPAPDQPAPPAPPAPPANTAPVLGQASASSSQVACTAGYPQPATTTISVQATDNAGVTGVTATLSGAETGTRALAHGAGNTWSFVYDPTDIGIPNGSTVTITLRATDGLLTSNPSAVSVPVYCFG